MPVLSIAKNEWARLFMSKHGWVAIFAFGLIWGLFLFYVIRPAAQYISSIDVGFISDFLFPRFDVDALSRWDATEIGLYWIFALYLLPFFTMISAADQIASDKARGTLRFLVLRASRSQIFFGRFLGQYLVQLLVILVTLVSVLALIAFYSPDNVPVALSEAPIVMVNLALVLLPYVALMALFSVLSSSARQATLYAIIGWIVLWFLLGYIQNKFGPIAVLDWVLPGSHFSSLIKLRGWDTLSLAPIPLIQTIVLLTLGWVAMHRSDL